MRKKLKAIIVVLTICLALLVAFVIYIETRPQDAQAGHSSQTTESGEITAEADDAAGASEETTEETPAASEEPTETFPDDSDSVELFEDDTAVTQPETEETVPGEDSETQETVNYGDIQGENELPIEPFE